MIRKMFNKVIDIIDSISRARAAATFVRMGRNDLARNIMLKDHA